MARRIGLVHEVVSADRLEERGAAMVAELLKGGPEAQAGAKRLGQLVRPTPPGGRIPAAAPVAAGAPLHDTRHGAAIKAGQP